MELVSRKLSPVSSTVTCPRRDWNNIKGLATTHHHRISEGKEQNMKNEFIKGYTKR